MIVQYPDKILRQISEPVGAEEDINPLLSQMFEQLDKTEGIGLAAVQMGVLKRVFLLRQLPSNQKIVFINPTVVNLYDKNTIDSKEGCLSIGNGVPRQTIKRYDRVDVSYTSSSGQALVQTFVGLDAIVCQHEIDHLNGVLFIDYLSRLKRSMLLKKM